MNHIKPINLLHTVVIAAIDFNKQFELKFVRNIDFGFYINYLVALEAAAPAAGLAFPDRISCELAVTDEGPLMTNVLKSIRSCLVKN